MGYMRDKNGRRLDSIVVPGFNEILGRPAGRAVSTRPNRLTGGRLTNSAGDGRTYKVRHYFPQACGHLTLWYANVYAGGWAETPNTNPLYVRAALVKSDGTVFAVTFNNDKPFLYLPASGQLAAPSAPTLTAGTAGNLTASAAYYVVVSLTNPAGETTVSGSTQVTVGATTPSITVTAPTPVAGATGYSVYCGLAAGASTGPFYLVASRGFGENAVIANNPTAALPLVPTSNTTGAATSANAGTPPMIATSDPIPADITAGDFAYTITHVTTPAVNQLIPVGTAVWGVSGTGEGNSGGDFTGNHASIPANNTTAYSPYFITGLTNDPSKPSVAILGDSLPAGTGDPNLGPGDQGFAVRGLNNGYPYAWLAQGGELTTDFLNLSGTGKQRRLTRMIAASHCTVSLGNYGTNDIGAASNTATIKTNLLTIWSVLKRRGQRVYWCTITPRAKSLDGWRTAGPGNGTTTGQFFYENASWGANGGALSLQETVRRQINQWLRAPAAAGAGNSALVDAGGNLDGIVDVGLTVEVNSDGTAISINGTTGAVSGLGGGYWKATGASTTTASGTATGGSTTTIVDSGQAWTTNQWAGYMAILTSGAASGQASQVLSNTATTLTLATTLTAAVASGAGYQLYQGWTQDGIHPTQQAHAAMATPVTTWAAAL